MTRTENFQRYADAVEECAVDGNWERLRDHFTEDVVHERSVGALYDFRQQGIDDVIAGYKESSNNIDRRFDRRIFVATEPISETDKRVRLPWVCLFVLDGQPACVDEGIEVATYRDNHICHLVPGVADYMARAE